MEQGDCRPPLPGQELPSLGRLMVAGAEPPGNGWFPTGRGQIYMSGMYMCGPVWGRKHSLMLLTAHKCFLLIIPARRNFFILIFGGGGGSFIQSFFFSFPSFNC